MSYDPAEHSISEVNDYLADHPDETEAVLAAEQAHGDDARVTLVADLERKASKGDDDEAPAYTAADEEYVKPEDANISPPGEYPTEGIFGYITEEVEA